MWLRQSFKSQGLIYLVKTIIRKLKLQKQNLLNKNNEEMQVAITC